jgi:hypothetical protein
MARGRRVRRLGGELGAGSVMGVKLRRYCNGTHFAYQSY